MKEDRKEEDSHLFGKGDEVGFEKVTLIFRSVKSYGNERKDN